MRCVPSCWGYNAGMQYTIRNIDPEADRRLRKMAVAEGKSVNAFLVEQINHLTGLNGKPVKRRNLRDLIGKHHFDKGFDETIASFRKIDPELWK